MFKKKKNRITSLKTDIIIYGSLLVIVIIAYVLFLVLMYPII
jgi:hypothetical protein